MAFVAGGRSAQTETSAFPRRDSAHGRRCLLPAVLELVRLLYGAHLGPIRGPGDRLGLGRNGDFKSCKKSLAAELTHFAEELIRRFCGHVALLRDFLEQV